jgi:hypothetical protein
LEAHLDRLEKDLATGEIETDDLPNLEECTNPGALTEMEYVELDFEHGRSGASPHCYGYHCDGEVESACDKLVDPLGNVALSAGAMLEVFDAFVAVSRQATSSGPAIGFPPDRIHLPVHQR